MANRIAIQIALLICIAAHTVCDKLTTQFEWKYVNYAWESEDQKNEFINNGKYDQSAVILYDVDMSEDGVFFVTAPADDGVPASLMTVSGDSDEGGPLVKPYPDWSWFNKTDCSGITSVYRVEVDSCNRLWVLDTGKVGSEAVCSPQLLVFDLSTNELLQKKTIENDVASNADGQGLLVTLAVDIENHDCESPTAYIADTEGYGLVVMDMKTDPIRVNGAVFEPDPDYKSITIEGTSFSTNDGVFGLAISLPRETSDGLTPVLYTANLASNKLNYLDTVDWDSTEDTSEIQQEPHELPGQTAAIAISPYTQILFFSDLENTAIRCWDTYKDFSDNYTDVVDQDSTTLQFPSGMKVRSVRGSKEKFITLTNRYQKVVTDGIDTSEVNFRVLTSFVSVLTEETKCVNVPEPDSPRFKMV